MTEIIIKKSTETSKPVYKLLEGKYIDQFGNKLEGKVCSCGKLDIKREMIVYTNYGGYIRKIYACRTCINDFGEDSRFNRDKRLLSLHSKRKPGFPNI